MYKIYSFVILLIFHGCAAATNNEVVNLESQTVTAVNPKVIEIKEGIDIYKQIIKAHETKKPTK